MILTVGAFGVAFAPAGKRPIAAVFSVVSALGGSTAVAVLARAFAVNDWRLVYTVGHSRPDIASPLRIAGVWAGPEGSLLLWTTMLAMTVLVLARTPQAWPSRLIGLLTGAYGLTLLTVSQPFERLPAPPGSGTGLQPVLEHPAMVWHPPILYLGLIGLLVPTALILGTRRAAADGQLVRQSLLLALAALTAGLATGSNWAYVELGWGGFWAWDPIENAGLIAWLAGGSMLHRLAPVKSTDDREVGWSPAVLVLAAITAISVIWATTITRTGVLNSVHSFANEPTLRAVLLTIAGCFTVGALVLAFTSARTPSADGSTAERRTGVSLHGALVLILAAIAVAVGTYEPAIEVLLSSNPFELSGRFYTMLLWPIAVAGAAARCWATVKRAGWSNAALATPVVGAVTALAGVGLGLGSSGVGPFGLILAAAGGAVIGAAGFDRLVTGRNAAGTTSPVSGWAIHLGIGVLLVGIAGSMAATSLNVVALVDQEAATEVGLVVHRGVELEAGSGTDEAVATLELLEPGSSTPTTFQPRLVSYVRTGASSAEVATDRGWWVDTQVVLLDAGRGQATYRINRHPGMTLVWLGAAITTLGLAVEALRRFTAQRSVADTPSTTSASSD